MPEEKNKFISGSCIGEKCHICKHDATHKVGEEILYDDPNPARHNFTVYVCCEHFQMLFGPAAKRYCEASGH